MPVLPHPYKAVDTVTWTTQVEAASSAHDVIEAARDFLAQFTPYEIHALPEPCKPPAKIVDADDITAYAFALVRHECADGADHAELVHKLAAFFSQAARHLAEIAAHPAAQAEESRHSA